MVEYAGLLAYLWFTIGNLSTLFGISLIMLLITLVIWYLGNSIATGGLSWLTMDKDEINSNNCYITEIENAIRNRTKLFFLTKIFTVMVIISVFVPSRNQIIIIFSATPLLKSGIDISQKVADSNTTKSIGTILNNSLKYLEKQSNELNK